MNELLYISIALNVAVILLVLLFRPKPNNNLFALSTKLDELFRKLDGLTASLRQDLQANRQEAASTAAQNRQELNDTLHAFRREMTDTLRLITEQNRKGTEAINKTVEEKITALIERIDTHSRESREAMAGDWKEFSQVQRERFGLLEDKQQQLVLLTEKKLEHIRETVEEKLQKTLNERLGQSFELVRGQLESVQKGLGEMQTLAQDVGGLKKVLSNVKMRGGFGEVQLHMLLENILAPEQYEANVATRPGSAERVEFAVKFPNKEGDRDYVWLPIDAKFPKDAYEQLQDAYDLGDTAQIEASQKNLEAVIRKMAKDICEKYIDPPGTTSFGILFLPFEGLFAEVVRKASLLEEIQRDCKVVITGPTTLAVILNSLQMGFRTLAIQKRSSEVWQVLGAVKKEFIQFGSLLDKAQRNIQTGLNQLDDVVGVRTRAIQRRLKGVELLDEGKSDALSLGGAAEPDEEEA